jgi:hypothetical protein
MSQDAHWDCFRGAIAESRVGALERTGDIGVQDSPLQHTFEMPLKTSDVEVMIALQSDVVDVVSHLTADCALLPGQARLKELLRYVRVATC